MSTGPLLDIYQLDSGMRLEVALPQASGPRPAVVLLHERYGILQHQRDLARRMADAGYVAVLPDLFHRFTGDREALERGDARADLADETSLADLDETLAFLRERSFVGAEPVGIVGFCQSGREPMLYAARRSEAVAGIGVLYGGAGPGDWQHHDLRPESVGAFIPAISCPVLGLFGEADHVVPVEGALRLRDALEASRKRYRMRIYRDTPHGWLNDTMPGRFRPEAAAAAWDELVRFLEQCFTGGWPQGEAVWDFQGAIATDYDFSRNRRLA